MNYKRIFPTWLSKLMMVLTVVFALILLIEDYKGNVPALSRLFLCALAFSVFYLDYNIVKYNDQNDDL